MPPAGGPGAAGGGGGRGGDGVRRLPGDGLSHQAEIKGANLSGGQKQRMLIARALAGDPEILILDDSSSAWTIRPMRRCAGPSRPTTAAPPPSWWPAGQLHPVHDPYPGDGRRAGHRLRHPPGAAGDLPGLPGDLPRPDGRAGLEGRETPCRREAWAKKENPRTPRGTIRRIARYLTRYRWVLLALLVCTLVSNVGNLLGRPLPARPSARRWMPDRWTSPCGLLRQVDAGGLSGGKSPLLPGEPGHDAPGPPGGRQMRQDVFDKLMALRSATLTATRPATSSAASPTTSTW